MLMIGRGAKGILASGPRPVPTSFYNKFTLDIIFFCGFSKCFLNVKLAIRGHLGNPRYFGENCDTQVHR